MPLEQKSVIAFLAALKKLDAGFAALPEFSATPCDESRQASILTTTL